MMDRVKIRACTQRLVCLAAAGGLTAAATAAEPIHWEAAFDAQHFLGIVEPDALFGSSVAIAPDVDGDGWAELFVGSPAFDGGGLNNNGKATLFAGVSGVETAFYGSGETEALSGRSILARRVPDGMGGFIDALMVGSPFQDAGRDRDAGAVLLFDASSGASLGSIHGINGPAANFGTAMAFVGDLNGDGMDEIAVGAPNVDLAPGEVVVFDGATLQPMRTLVGIDEFGGFGSSVGAAGDVNNDGTPDIIVGAPFASYLAGENPQGQDPNLMLQARGQAFIYSGADFSLIRMLRRPVEDRSAAGSAFGNSVDGVGDINGDGYSEVIVGTPDPVGFVGNPGNAYVFDGQTGDLIYRFTGEGPASAPRWGSVVKGIGDVDGDGIPDMAVTGTELPLRSIFPAGPGRVKVYSGVNGLPELEIVGEFDNDAFGTSLATGDVNGDGIVDYLVGAENASLGSGLAYLFLGVEMVPPTPPCEADRTGDQIVDVFDLLDYLGFWFAGDADLNGDLTTDVFDLLAYLDLWFTGCP